MTPDNFSKLKKFVVALQDFSFPRSQWFHGEHFDLYLRSYKGDYSSMLDPTWLNCNVLVISNINVHHKHQNKGVFKDLIKTLLASDIQFKYLKAENVINEFLESHLIANGWAEMKKDYPGPASYYLERK